MAGNVGGDHTRIAAQIIPGIGFIGAGVVIRERGTVVGITSAATIFMVASIGMAVGSSLYVTAIFTTLLLLVSLVVIGSVEDRLSLHSRMMNFLITATTGIDTVPGRVRQIVDEVGVHTRGWRTDNTNTGILLEFDAEVTRAQERALLTRIGALNVRCEARLIAPVTAL